jgi:hypothetical protein
LGRDIKLSFVISRQDAKAQSLESISLRLGESCILKKRNEKSLTLMALCSIPHAKQETAN